MAHYNPEPPLWSRRLTMSQSSHPPNGNICPDPRRFYQDSYIGWSDGPSTSNSWVPALSRSGPWFGQNPQTARTIRETQISSMGGVSVPVDSRQAASGWSDAPSTSSSWEPAPSCSGPRPRFVQNTQTAKQKGRTHDKMKTSLVEGISRPVESSKATSGWSDAPSTSSSWEPAPSCSEPRPRFVQNTQTAKQKGRTHDKMKTSLVEGISRPVESSKATRMMQMMGWQGGALGKSGTGLTVPIAPNFNLQAGAGLGHTEDQEKTQQPPKQTKRCGFTHRQLPPTPKKREPKPSVCPIRLELLEDLRSFVSDNKRIVMTYEPTLSDARRKLIHRVVENIRSNDVRLNRCQLDRPVLLTVFKAVCESNAYYLKTHSVGQKPFRQIQITKEAPAHVYLITNYDLRDEDNGGDGEDNEIEVKEDDQSSKNIIEVISDDDEEAVTSCGKDLKNLITLHEETTDDAVSDVGIQNVAFQKMKNSGNMNLHVSLEILRCPQSNVFTSQPNQTQSEDIEVKSVITKEHEDETVEVNREEQIKQLLLKYLSEFFTTAEYTEMWFLGDFDEVEQRVVDDFIANIKKSLDDVVTYANWVIDTIQDNKFTVQCNQNGREVIVKRTNESSEHL